MTAPYTAGTIHLESGSTTVTGDGTGWEVSLIIGGTIYVEFDGGNPMPIATVDGDTEITAALKWTGPTGTYSYAIVRDTAYGQQTVTNAQALATYIQRLNNPALAATAGVTPGSNKLLLFTGANSATVIDLEDILQGVKFDEEVPTLADRAAYDGEAEGFRVLVANIGDGRSAFFTKKSAAAGDWSVAFYITGATGGAGPYTDITIGPTTTLPAGSQAEVTLVPVSPGVIRLDFALPKGVNGDVVGPAAPVTVGNLAQFITADGKTLGRATIGSPALLGRASAGVGDVERLTVAQVRQMLGGWELIGSFDLAGLSQKDVTGLGVFKALKIELSGAFNASSPAGLRFSSDNGATFPAANNEFRYTIADGRFTFADASAVTSAGDGDSTWMPILDHSGDTDSPSIAECIIRHFNDNRRAVGLVESRIGTPQARYVRKLGAAHSRALAMNAIRFSLAAATTVQFGSLDIWGLRG